MTQRHQAEHGHELTDQQVRPDVDLVLGLGPGLLDRAGLDDGEQSLGVARRDRWPSGAGAVAVAAAARPAAAGAGAGSAGGRRRRSVAAALGGPPGGGPGQQVGGDLRSPSPLGRGLGGRSVGLGLGGGATSAAASAGRSLLGRGLGVGRGVAALLARDRQAERLAALGAPPQ